MMSPEQEVDVLCSARKEQRSPAHGDLEDEACEYVESE